jgi:hypothetical protein
VKVGENEAGAQLNHRHFSDFVDNGNPSDLRSNEWTVADDYDFDTATTGCIDIRIQWSQTSSKAGPAKFALFAKNLAGPAPSRHSPPPAASGAAADFDGRLLSC